jgi:Rhodopirellula transposase DDE domain
MSPVADSLVRRYDAVKPHLTERQRRVWLGAEARELGSSGVRIVADAVGVSPDTVRRGRDELDDPQPLEVGRSRVPGGGRKRADMRDPGLAGALDKLVDPESRGDPMTPLRWTCKSLRQLAAQLCSQGHQASATLVARLLHEAGYSLQSNAKTVEGNQNPDRDAQFRHIHDTAAGFLAAGDPVVSIDCKKKELVGQFKNGGTEWRPQGAPERVNVHDFIDHQLGKAIPYGVYDLGANTGWVTVGVDHETAAFAVNTLRSWWNTVGRGAYLGSTRLLITADSGGANGNRRRAWKTELAALAAETGLQISVCHLPPGTSKWNKIEHRLFSQITRNWRGRPLTSHETIINLIGATTTTTGLTVTAQLDTAAYPTGVKVTDREMKQLPIIRDSWHGEWNYTLLPTRDTPDPP